MSEKIKFPCAVESKGLTLEQKRLLLEKFVELGARLHENFEGASDFYVYYGVDEDGWTAHWDRLSCFALRGGVESVTVYTYEQVIAFEKDSQEESVAPVVNNTSNSANIAEGWIEWKAGEKWCPSLAENTMVEVVLGSGKTGTDRLSNLWWRSLPNKDQEIVKYRTVSNESTSPYISVETSITFKVNIKGETFNLTQDELNALYLQICAVDGLVHSFNLGG